MDRLHTMARFAEPEDVAPVAECINCGAELYEGEDVYEVDGYEIFCSTECLAESVADKVTL